MDKDIKRIEQLTDHIQQVFNDFALCVNLWHRVIDSLDCLACKLEWLAIGAFTVKKRAKIVIICVRVVLSRCCGS